MHIRCALLVHFAFKTYNFTFHSLTLPNSLFLVLCLEMSHLQRDKRVHAVELTLDTCHPLENTQTI